jgi:SAM-dependent methyltransferase
LGAGAPGHDERREPAVSTSEHNIQIAGDSPFVGGGILSSVFYDRIARYIDTRQPWLMRGIIRAGSAWAGTLSRGDRTYRIDGFDLAVDTGVAPPVFEFHRALLAGITDGHVVDLGCGSGYVTVFAARAGARVTSVDINELAIANTLKNAEAAGVRERVSAQVGNILSDITDEADYILINPPWFDHPLGERFRATSSPTLWAGLFTQARALLSAKGELRIFLPRFRVPEIAAQARSEGWRDPEVRRVCRKGPRLTRWLKPVPLILPAMAVVTFGQTKVRDEQNQASITNA